MGIEDKATYGEYYWASQVEAQKLYFDEVEAELSSTIRSMYQNLGIADVLPKGVDTFIHKMTSQKSFAWGTVLARFGSEVADSVVSKTLDQALMKTGYWMAEKFHDKRMTAGMADILYQRKGITKELWAARNLSEGFGLGEASLIYGSTLPYPTIQDIMLFSRYADGGRLDRSRVWKMFDVPADEFEMWEWLTKQRLSTDQTHTLLRRGLINDVQYNTEMQKIGWDTGDAAGLKETGWMIPNAMLMVQGGLLQDESDDWILKQVTKADIHPDYARSYIDAVLTKPSTMDVVSYELRQDPNLADLPDRLRRIGIHPDYFGLYKELAQVIPPVADIITMAVREAFTPAIAARFGQYEDFPEPLADWAGKKGLTKDWAERYWAAHWALPSATQGFEMLHRGVIGVDDLNLLLRAQDVMPFWRDKLTKIAYRPLTRVDVRRMYKEGILDEVGVYEAYLDNGYDETNAKSMTEFTVKYVLSQQAKFTSRDVVTAYTKRMIDKSEAHSLLLDLGIRSENVSYIINTADYKRKWALTDEKISGIRNLYKRGVYDENKARAELYQLALPAEQVNVLFEQWWYEKTGDLAPTWTKAETIRFAKAGQITVARAQTELERMGYDAEHVSLYMESLQ